MWVLLLINQGDEVIVYMVAWNWLDEKSFSDGDNLKHYIEIQPTTTIFDRSCRFFNDSFKWESVLLLSA